MQQSFRTQVGNVTILAGVIALASYCLVAASVQYNFEVFTDVSLMLTMPGVDTALVKWSMITDVLGYYLLLIPALFLLHDGLKEETPWQRVWTAFGGGYILVGAIGAAILAAAWPSLIETYRGNGGAESTRQSFETVSTLVYGGLWNLLGMLCGGVWWVATGLLLGKHNRFLSGFTIILGMAALMDGIGGMFRLGAVSEAGLNIYLLLAPVWAIATGFAFRKKRATTFQQTPISQLQTA